MQISTNDLLACVEAMSADERRVSLELLRPGYSYRGNFTGTINAVPHSCITIRDSKPVEDLEDRGVGQTCNQPV